MPIQKELFSRIGLPSNHHGQTIGLLGGSFAPPHAGHVHISQQALKRFGLDQVWWLVSPGNPLKEEGPASLDRRMSKARSIIHHPKIHVTDIETRLGTRYTASTLRQLTRKFPMANFIWLMGADNLASFHKWDQWREIMNIVPIGVLARPGDRISARTSKAACIYRFAQFRGRESRLLAHSRPPSWCFVNVPMVNMSSTTIRERGDWIR